MALIVAACTPGASVPVQPYGTYLGADTRLLDDDLVNFQVRMSGQLGPKSLTDYADCVAARYTLVRGYSHTRHVRTNVYEEGGVQVADAIYTISPTTPRGANVINAAEQVATCEAEGIPTL